MAVWQILPVQLLSSAHDFVIGWLKVISPVCLILIVIQKSLEVRLSLMASLVLNLPFWTGSKVLLYLKKTKTSKQSSQPPKGMKRGKGAVSHEPQSVTPSQRMREFPGENVSVLSGKLFCTALFLNSSPIIISIIMSIIGGFRKHYRH